MVTTGTASNPAILDIIKKQGDATSALYILINREIGRSPPCSDTDQMDQSEPMVLGHCSVFRLRRYLQIWTRCHPTLQISGKTWTRCSVHRRTFINFHSTLQLICILSGIRSKMKILSTPSTRIFLHERLED